MKKISYFLVNCLNANKALFIGLFIIFVIGMCIGAYSLNIISEENMLEIRTGTDTYFSLSQLNSVDKNEIFINTLEKSILSFSIMWLSGFFIFLIPVVFVQILLKGIRLGFSAAYFTAVYGLKGAIYSSFELILSNFLLLPLFIFYGVYIISFSKEKHRIKLGILKRKVLLNSFLAFALICIICLGISGINGYVLPPVFRLLGAFM